MNWDALGAIGEVAGAVAVVITLVYVARQLGEHTKSMRIQSLDATFGEWNSLLRDLQDPDGVGGAYVKSLEGEDLSDREKHQLTFFYRRVFNLFAKLYHLSKQGAVDSFNVTSIETSLPYLQSSHFFSEWWPKHRDRYEISFQGYVDERIKENG
jgi:hypothetical protein